MEIAAALFGRFRIGETRFEEARAAVARPREDAGDVYEIVEIDPIAAEKAIEVAERRLLRAYDCLQLATAFLLAEQRALRDLEPLAGVVRPTLQRRRRRPARWRPRVVRPTAARSG